MNQAIVNYNALQAGKDQEICKRLMEAIDKTLIAYTSKIWHGSPVWFIEDNPIVGYSKLKDSIQLLFWSGQTFESELKPVGKFKAAEVRFTDLNQIETDTLRLWLKQSITIQWDYKNIVRTKGVLNRLET